jgi:hypothetical protein
VVYGPGSEQRPAVGFGIRGVVIKYAGRNRKVADKYWTRVPHNKTRHNVHINTRPETLVLWVIAERILWRRQQQFSTNAWAKTVRYCLVSPHVLPQRLTGNHYRDFLLHDLPKLLEDVPLYFHDGATEHVSRAAREFLNNAYHDRWTGTEPTAWPPRSTDLNPLDFYL